MPNGAFIIFAFNTSSAFVALLTSYYAFRTNRLVGNSVLAAMSVGFMLLGLGLAVDAGTSLVTGRLLVEFPIERLLVTLASLTYLGLQMVAYLVIAVGYARSNYGMKQMGAPLALAGAVGVGLYGFSLLSYFVALILLAFVVFQG